MEGKELKFPTGPGGVLDERLGINPCVILDE